MPVDSQAPPSLQTPRLRSASKRRPSRGNNALSQDFLRVNSAASWRSTLPSRSSSNGTVPTSLRPNRARLIVPASRTRAVRADLKFTTAQRMAALVDLHAPSGSDQSAVPLDACSISPQTAWSLDRV